MPLHPPSCHVDPEPDRTKSQFEKSITANVALCISSAFMDIHIEMIINRSRIVVSGKQTIQWKLIDLPPSGDVSVPQPRPRPRSTPRPATWRTSCPAAAEGHAAVRARAPARHPQHCDAFRFCRIRRASAGNGQELRGPSRTAGLWCRMCSWSKGTWSGEDLDAGSRSLRVEVIWNLQIYRPIDGHRLVESSLLLSRRHRQVVLLANMLVWLIGSTGPAGALLGVIYYLGGHLSFFANFPNRFNSLSSSLN